MECVFGFNKGCDNPSEVSSEKRLSMLMLVVVITITVDSQIRYTADFIPEQLSSNGRVASESILTAVIFVVIQYSIKSCQATQ